MTQISLVWAAISDGKQLKRRTSLRRATLRQKFLPMKYAYNFHTHMHTTLLVGKHHTAVRLADAQYIYATPLAKYKKA